MFYAFFAALAVIFTVALIGCAEAPKDNTADDSPPVSEEMEESISAWLVRIDGKEVGYLKDESDVNALSDLFKQEKLEELSGSALEIVRISIESELTGEAAYCKAEDILSAEQLANAYHLSGGRISFSVTVNESETKYISFETVYNNSSSYYEGT